MKIYLLVVIFLMSVSIGANNSSSEIIIDYSIENGKISNFIMGTTDSPFYDEDSYWLLKEAGFKIVEVMLWFSRDLPPEIPSRLNGTLSLEQEETISLKHDIEKVKKQIPSIIKIGATPLIFMITSKKPLNLDTFAKQVQRIVMDLREVALKSGKELSIFRFGNEPDLFHPAMPPMWKGTKEEFFETYKVWAKSIKSVSSNYIVEAPGFASSTARYIHEEYYKEVNDFTKDFLKYCKKENVPLDIFSFHYYGTNLNNISLEVEAVKKELLKYPYLSPIFGVPKVAIDEWNIRVGFDGKIFNTIHTATHNISALINMIKSGVYVSIRFGGVGTTPPPPFPPRIEGFDKKMINIGHTDKRGPDFLMVNWDGSPKIVFYAFKAFSKMLSTPHLLKTVVDESSGVYAIAGRSKNANQINLLISLYDEIDAQRSMKQEEVKESSYTFLKYKTLIKNLPWDTVKDKVKIIRYLVDEKKSFKLVQTESISKTENLNELSFNFGFNIPSVNLIEITW